MSAVQQITHTRMGVAEQQLSLEITDMVYKNLSTLKDMQEKGDLCDVNITTAEDRVIMAHSCIIAAACPEFRPAFHPVGSTYSIQSTSFSYDLWQSFMNLIYTGTTKIAVRSAKDFWSLAYSCGVNLPERELTTGNTPNKIQSPRKVVPVQLPKQLPPFTQSGQLPPVTQSRQLPPVTQSGQNTVTSVAGGRVEEMVFGESMDVDDTEEPDVESEDAVYEVESAPNPVQTSAGVSLLQNSNANVQNLPQGQLPEGTVIQVMNMKEQVIHGPDGTPLQVTCVNDDELQVIQTLLQDSSGTTTTTTSHQVITTAPSTTNYDPGVVISITDPNTIQPTEVDNSVSITATNAIPKPPSGESYKCTICGKEFVRRRSLHFHYLLHQGLRPHKCTVCGMGFVQKNCLTNHMKCVHSNNRPFKCKECPASFKQIAHLRNHKMRHTGERPYVCHKCDKGFITKAHMDLHIESAHGNSIYICHVEGCGKQFKADKMLKAHIASHNKPYECAVCGARFSYKKGLRSHISNGHDDKNKPIDIRNRKEYVCHICDEGNFITQHMLKLHMVEIHGEESLIKCKHCEVFFINKESIRKHMREKHSEIWRVQHGLPPVPDEVEIQEKKARQKRKPIKSEDLDLECKLCQKICANKNKLRDHMKIHMKRYKCPVCNAAFSDNRALQCHVSNGHTEDNRPINRRNLKEFELKCSRCYEVFSHRNPYKIHMIIEHDGDDLCKCPYCSEVFMNEDSIRKHCREKHKGLSNIRKEIGDLCDIKAALNNNQTLTVCGTVIAKIKQEKPEELKVEPDDEQNGDTPSQAAILNTIDKITQNDTSDIPEVNIDGIDTNLAGDDTNTADDIVEYDPKETNEYRCSTCKLSFKTVGHLCMHNESHTSKASYVVRKLGSALKTSPKTPKENMPKFRRSFTPKLTKAIKKEKVNEVSLMRNVSRCAVCDKSFGSKRRLESHMEIHETK